MSYGSSHKRSKKVAKRLERRKRAELSYIATLREDEAKARTVPGSGKRG
jgi:hypothetical protein